MFFCEGRQRAFLLKKWQKNDEKNAKNIERSTGSLVLLHNPYQMIISQVRKESGFFIFHKSQSSLLSRRNVAVLSIATIALRFSTYSL